jgi:hypothetical protein
MISTMVFRSTIILLFVSVIFCNGMNAQTTFQQRSTNAARLQLTMSNYGTIGRPAVRSNVQGLPSMAYPQKGKEHLFESGLWIGSIVNGQKLVSSGAVDASSGYAPGASGFEFTPTGAPIQERSKLLASPNYSASAVSHQDFVFQMTDANTLVPGTSLPINGHTNPLLARINLEVYNWNYSYTDYFVICNYTITNMSTNRWDSVWMGQWADLVVRDVNVTRDVGTAFYNKGRNGIDTKNMAIYAWLGDHNADDAPYIQSFGAMQFLGMDWKGMFFNPHKPDTFVSRGFPAPQTHYNFWNFNSTSAPYIAPTNDLERYLKLSTTIDSALIMGGSGPTNGPPANWIQLLSAGPIPSVEPGESFTYTLAYVAARNSAYQVAGSYVVASPEALAEMKEHFIRTRSTYLGENTNEDGKYDPALDLNSNGKLDRYILPEPPSSPKVKIIPSDQQVDLYWDKSAAYSIDPITRKQDFEGFRLYRSNPGDDLDRDLTNDYNLVAQWDSVNNTVGYNNGFDAIQLADPIFFEGDTTPYTFHYSMKGLLNGWQYQFILTAFDKGDDALKIPSLESSYSDNEFRVYTGTSPAAITENGNNKIGVYPNPYRTSAAWDGQTSRTHKLYFTNLPRLSEIHIFTSNGDLIATLQHDAATYTGQDAKWFEQFGDAPKTEMSGGEHAWDLLSDYKTTVSSGVYLFTVKDLQTGKTEIGKFAILK